MSKVVLIGDRAVGKTSMVHALAKKPYEKVELKNGPDEEVAQTESIGNRTLQVICDLPGNPIDLSLVWIDTPGELYIDRQKQEDKTAVWQEICKELQTSRYIILLLPPHQSLFNNRNTPESECITTSQNSKNRFKDWWIPFLSQNCQQAKHILICRHKADMYNANIEDLVSQNKYGNPGFSWKEYFDLTINDFGEIKNQIEQYQKQHKHQEVRRFVTTIHNRSLLELPWLYIGTRESIRPQY